MEQKLIIAEILKHKPHGIKLYSPIFGNCTLCYVKDESSDICVRRPYNEVNYFNFDGVYHWSEEYKKKSLNDAWQKVQEQFKEDIDWNALTESQCKALHFISWQSEEDVEEEISCLQSELDEGHLTKEEFDKKVANEKNTLGLRLIPLYLYPSLPVGITLTSIGGEEIVFDGSNIDIDVRFGCIAWGIKPKKD